MIFHSPTIELERDRRRRDLMKAIAEFKDKQATVVGSRAIRQLEYALAQLGGPIDE